MAGSVAGSGDRDSGLIVQRGTFNMSFLRVVQPDKSAPLAGSCDLTLLCGSLRATNVESKLFCVVIIATQLSPALMAWHH